MACLKANHLLQAEFGVPPLPARFDNKRTGLSSGVSLDQVLFLPPLDGPGK